VKGVSGPILTLGAATDAAAGSGGGRVGAFEITNVPLPEIKIVNTPWVSI
jgi:hypothetical protein